MSELTLTEFLEMLRSPFGFPKRAEEALFEEEEARASGDYIQEGEAEANNEQA